MPKPKVKHVWKEKEKLKNDEESLIVQTTFKEQDKPTPWILANGYSSYMSGDKKKFEKLQPYEGGLVKFGNNVGAKIIDKCTIKINDKNIRLEEVLFMIRLKHSLLSINQIYDRGYNVTLKKYRCEIRRMNNDRLVTVGIRTSKILYTLIETSKGSCLLKKEDEDWLGIRELGISTLTIQ